MRELRKCRACGVEIQSNAPFGHCPQCLIAMGIGPAPKEALVSTEALPVQSALRAPHSALVTVRYFGDYELLEEIARGGMGTVFKARQTSLNRLVALKLISAGTLATEDLVKRFKAEAESAASLAHPNIVPIFEIGQHEGQHYFSMGLIEGGSLAQKIRSHRRARPEPGSRRGNEADGTVASTGPPPHVGGYAPHSLRDSAQLLSTIARAVHYAHQRGVLHRDIKPGNILLEADRTPHLTDFGLAKLVEKETTLTHTNAVMGTPAYMSPEQARGESKDVTTATDVWGLGAVLYETLTGSPPFGGGTSMETIRQVIDEEPRRPSILNPAIDRDLETICLKCLQNEPERRYASAAALADDLDRWHRAEPILARRATLFERVTMWARRQPALAAAVVLLHVVLLLGIGGVVWQWRGAEMARRGEATERRRAEAGLRRAESAEADALARLQEAKLNYVRANRQTGRMGHRYDSLAELARAAARTNSVALRNEAIGCLMLPDVRLLKSLPMASEIQGFTANLRQYFTNDALGNLIVRDTETDALLHRITQQGAPLVNLISSPDGHFMATTDRAGNAQLWTMSLQGTPHLLTSTTGAAVLAFTPDSRALVQQHADDSLHFLSTATGADEKSFPGLAKQLYWGHFLFNPAGDKFLTVVESKLTIRRASDGGHLMDLKPPAGETYGITRAAWHPDGRRIAGCWFNSVGLWDTGPRVPSDGDGERNGTRIEREVRRPRTILEGHEGAVVGVAFSDTGEYLASTAWDHTTRFWNMAQKLNTLRISDGGNGLCMGTGGDRLAFQTWKDRFVRIYESAHLPAQRFDLPPPASAADRRVAGAVFSSDNELIAVPNKVGISLFRPPNPAPLALLPVPKMYNLRFAPDCQSLFTGGESGMQRWPMVWSADRSELTIGPPELLDVTLGRRTDWVDLSADGQWLLAQAGEAVFSFRSAPPFEAVRFDKSIQMGSPPVISPDARWVATVTHSRALIQIWNARTGNLHTNLAYAGAQQSAFSFDGRWLACADLHSVALWQTGEWNLQRRIADSLVEHRHQVAFSPDDRIVAIGISERETRLVKFETGKELATLPTGELITSIAFSPDGTRLVIANESGYFQLWDLRRLRAQLKELRLDWDLPPYSPRPPALTNAALRVILHTNSLNKSLPE